MVKPRLGFSFCPFLVNLFWRKFSLPVPLLSSHLLWSPSHEGMGSSSCLQHSVSPSFPSSSSHWAGSYTVHIPPSSPHGPALAPCKMSGSWAGKNHVVQRLNERARRMRVLRGLSSSNLLLGAWRWQRAQGGSTWLFSPFSFFCRSGNMPFCTAAWFTLALVVPHATTSQLQPQRLCVGIRNKTCCLWWDKPRAQLRATAVGFSLHTAPEAASVQGRRYLGVVLPDLPSWGFDKLKTGT